MNWHRTQATILVDAGVDLLAFETFPAQKEAEAVVRLLRELPSCRAWISLSCKVCYWLPSCVAELNCSVQGHLQGLQYTGEVGWLRSTVGRTPVFGR